MATAKSQSSSEQPWRSNPPAACEACRKQKMRCTRLMQTSNEPGSPCDRCRRNDRPCNIPERKPQGRRPGAVGRYSGVEKAVRQIQNQVRKASRASNGRNGHRGTPTDTAVLDILSNLKSNSPPHGQGTANQSTETIDHAPSNSSPGQEQALASSHFNQDAQDMSPHRTDDSVSNPLGLLADAFDEAQANEEHNSHLDPHSSTTTISLADVPPLDTVVSMPDPNQPGELAQSMLRRPGYVSLGLNLDRGILEGALGSLFSHSGRIGQFANYFKTRRQEHPQDTGPDVDPVDLGLVSMEEVWYLFPIFFDSLHPINGILDPVLHTPEFVRPRSALLFTWILAITAQFDQNSGSLAKRLRLHGEKLSKHVHSCGYKSVEIAQGYYISLLAAVPANTLAEDHSWIYTTYALGIISDLGLEKPIRGSSDSSSRQSGNAASSCPGQLPHEGNSCAPPRALTLVSDAEMTNGAEWISSPQQQFEERLARNRERTWFRILLWERAHSAASGKVTPFPDNDLTRRVKYWWQHPLADPTDRYTCAFVILRRHLSILYYQVKEGLARSNNKRHWVRDLVDATLDPWRQAWLPTLDRGAPMADQIRNLFLHYVYMHGRLWTLSFALHDSSNTSQDATAMKEDCFEASVNCCEVTIRDLREIGRPMYCMMAPTWAMSSYAAVLALKLFPQLYGDRPSQQVELLALLAEVALQLEVAGTTPSHRFGIAALLGQHLLLVLRGRLSSLKEGATTTAGVQSFADLSTLPDLGFPSGEGQLSSEGAVQQDQTMSFFTNSTDPFLFSGLSPRGADAAQEVFADMMKEWGGLPFDGTF